MKGKKVDTDFVSEFICICANSGKLSPEDICNEAKNKIQAIDSRIKEVDFLKKERSKLIDVIITLDKKNVDKTKDKLALSFHGIPNIVRAGTICNLLQSTNNGLETKVFSKDDLYLIKYLLTLDIFKRQDNMFFKGSKYQEFVNFINKVYNI